MTQRTEPFAPFVEIDGGPATADLLVPALGAYGHFTAMQVRGGRVRGLGFHLARLDGATRELFGTGLDGAEVRDRVRHALASLAARGGGADASVRVNVFRPGEAPGTPPVLLVTVRPPAETAPGPRRVRSVPYQRPAAHLKHTGGFGQAYHIRQVAAEGYDEALLVGPGGEIAEGAITNIGFVDGGTVVWPDAVPHLRGVTLQILERALDRAGVPQARRPLRLADLGAYDAAFLANSRGTAPIGEIDGLAFARDAELLTRVGELYASEPWDEI